MNEEEEFEEYILSLIGLLDDNENLKQKSLLIRRSGTLISIQLILAFICVGLLTFRIYSRSYLLFFIFYAGIYIFIISSILTFILIHKSKSYLNPIREKQIRRELRSMELMRKKRECFHCNNKLSFLDYCSINKNESMNELKNIWKNPNVEIFCCSCYNKQNNIILKYNCHLYLIGLLICSILFIFIGEIYLLKFLFNIGIIGILISIILAMIFFFIGSRKSEYDVRIKAYLFIGILMIIFLNVFFLTDIFIVTKGLESNIFIITIITYLIIVIPFTIKFFYKTHKRKKEIKNMLNSNGVNK